MTKIFAQYGFQPGDKVKSALSMNLLDGAIFSPKDMKIADITGSISEFKKTKEDFEVFFDPQYYSMFLANNGNARLGYLVDCCQDYFIFKRRNELEREKTVNEIVERCVEFQKKLGLTGIITPNILISKSFNSIEGVIAKHFIRAAGEFSDKKNPIYASIVLSRDVLLEKEELELFLEEITMLDKAPSGFYVLISAQNLESRSDILHSDVVYGWMLLNYSLAVNGFKVINGYSDIMVPFLGALGAYAGATGWWSNLRTFSIDKFRPASGGGRLPNPRYLSTKLLNRISYFELDAIRRMYPEVLNGLTTDSLYDEQNGSMPERNKEVLQSWDAIRKLNQMMNGRSIEENLRECKKAITDAESLYAKLNLARISLEEKSDNSHLIEFSEGIDLLCRKAQIKIAP